MSKSTYLENQTIDYLAGSYVALFTGDPEEDGSGPELSGNGYARQASGWSSQVANPATLPQDVVFGPATDGWGTVTHFGIFDAQTGGNLLYYGSLDEPKPIGKGDEAKFAAGSLTIEEQ